MPDYTRKPKEEWRRWVWNRVTERIPKVARDGSRRADATVLYLVGPNDLDREVALSKGFRGFNVIAVDIDEECIVKVRKAHNLGICGRLVTRFLLLFGNTLVDMQLMQVSAKVAQDWNVYVISFI